MSLLDDLVDGYWSTQKKVLSFLAKSIPVSPWTLPVVATAQAMNAWDREKPLAENVETYAKEAAVTIAAAPIYTAQQVGFSDEIAQAADSSRESIAQTVEDAASGIGKALTLPDGFKAVFFGAAILGTYYLIRKANQ